MNSCLLVSGFLVRFDLGQYLELCAMDGPICKDCEPIWPTETKRIQKGCFWWLAQHPDSCRLLGHVGKWFMIWVLFDSQEFFLSWVRFRHREDIQVPLTSFIRRQGQHSTGCWIGHSRLARSNQLKGSMFANVWPVLYANNHWSSMLTKSTECQWLEIAD